jgi:Methyltransferase domain
MHHSGYVQYGCGRTAPASWTNFDSSPAMRIQRIPLLGPLLIQKISRPFPLNAYYGDVVKGLPIAPQSCAAIYCSHVLEHLSLHDLRTALRNTFGYLQPGGIFRCVLPDLEYLARDYLSRTEQQPAIHFMERSLLGVEDRPRRLTKFVRDWLGNSRHLWMWDYRSLAVELENVGFSAIRRASFGDAEDPRFNDVEESDRWHNCLGLECRKSSG